MSEEWKVKKCSVLDGDHVVPCSMLENATEYGNPHGKQRGIWAWRLYSTKSHKPTRTFWGAKSGEHVAKGVIFHFCPFCGEPIDAPVLEPKP